MDPPISRPPPPAPPPTAAEAPAATAASKTRDRDFLLHLEAYLARRDGVDKALKISRYAAKIALSSSLLHEAALPLCRRLRSFKSSVGLSRKAFRLGKFVQDVNALRASPVGSGHDLFLFLVAYGGEGLARAEFVGYVGSVNLKIRDLRRLREDEACVESSIEIAASRGIGCKEEELRLRKLREKKLMKKLSVVQDLADGLMALADIRDGEGRLAGPLLVSCAGLVSALISTHKNWVSC
ncbi:hypothetical protein NL676_025718 [Syzygium grande]|nr:hypothetical protein NL676_025718 [Syzygium grande]